MPKFVKGDVVKISPKWLDKGINPDTLYFVLEDYNNGRVKVSTPWNGFIIKYLTFVCGYEMVYKVGQIDLKELENKLK